MPNEVLLKYAKDNKVSYTTAWRHNKKGLIPKVSTASVNWTQPTMLKAEAASTSVRMNRTSVIDTPLRHANIDAGIIPYTYSSSGVQDKSTISVREAIILCQKAYWNVAIVRNVIDMMTEFSVSNIYLKDGNANSRKFFNDWLKTINVWDVQDQFYREYYRSGNDFILELNAKIKDKKIKEINKTFELSLAAVEIPYKYTFLNPADIVADNGLTFNNTIYYRVLQGNVLNRLRNPKTDVDKLMYEQLSPEVKKQIAKTSSVLLPLESKNVTTIFYKKQDYEAMAIPMVFPVLDDIEFILELKKMDLALARTCQQAVLLVTMGYESKDGTYNVNQASITAMQELFKNESIGRVLVADFTTKVDFKIPQIADLMDPRKYTVVERSIKEGLNSIISAGDAGEKFANQSIKVKVFIERLVHGRNNFISQFLQPQIDKISEKLGFKNTPTAYYQEFDLEDSSQWARIYTRLAEIGILTPDETLQALDTGKLPTDEENLAAQTKYKEMRDKGLYQPLIGGQKADTEGVNGRPQGTKTPQTTKKVSPIGTGSQKYSIKKFLDYYTLATELKPLIIQEIKKQKNIKKLTANQEEVLDTLVDNLIANESPETWKTAVAEYIKSPKDLNQETNSKITDLISEHNLEFRSAAVLSHCQLND